MKTVRARKKERHKLAKITVEVYRLFKIRDMTLAVEQSSDPVVKTIGQMIHNETSKMLALYIQRQQDLCFPNEAAERRKQERARRKIFMKMKKRVHTTRK